jgi:hypothetical protein
MDCPDCDRGTLKADPQTQETANRSANRLVGGKLTRNHWVCVLCGASFERSDL